MFFLKHKSKWNLLQINSDSWCTFGIFLLFALLNSDLKWTYLIQEKKVIAILDHKKCISSQPLKSQFDENLHPSFIKWGWNVFLYLFFQRIDVYQCPKNNVEKSNRKKSWTVIRFCLVEERISFELIEIFDCSLRLVTKAYRCQKVVNLFFIFDEEYHSWLWIFSSIVTWFLPISCWKPWKNGPLICH